MEVAESGAEQFPARSSVVQQSGIVLIFENAHRFPRDIWRPTKKYGVEPDMAMFGKALGNGYAITAVIGA